MRIQPPILAVSPAAQSLLRLARRYSAFDATVLITGETGVGKDVLARYIHACGRRRHEPFVTVDCPALPPTLVETALFGHERGAFTDAGLARAGRFELAGRGTIYLDAVTELSPSGQGALLRVVEERRVMRLGGTAALDVRARIIASADVAIEEHVTDGTFRAELFHRLRVLPLYVPPLRDRRADILPLARYFVSTISAHHQRLAPPLLEDAAEALIRYQWPGNVRELRHVIERVLLAGVERIDAASLPDDVLHAPDAYLASAGARRPTLDEVERRYIALTLQFTKGNQSRAAGILGISRKGLWEKRKRFGLA
jgi:DNA-binding NtrC family response regulator